MIRFIDEMDLAGKKVIARVDYNVPIKDGKIVDDKRIREGLPTLKAILDQNAALILCLHLGKPKGKVVPELTLAPVAEHLSKLLGRPVTMAPDCLGPQARRMAAETGPGQILMLENLRFYPGETGNDPEMGRELASMADVYCNDAFGTAHRSHASTVGIPAHIKERCGGLLLKRERDYLSKVQENPARPYVAISGGAKVSSKLSILHNLLDKVDRLIIGGAMANTFLMAQGMNMGASLVESDRLQDALDILAKAREKGVEVHLPVDFVLGESFASDSTGQVVDADAIPSGMMALDIGPKTLAEFENALDGAGTVVWNGPMGAFENPAFASGTVEIARAVAALDALTVAGGGDSAAAVRLAGVDKDFSFISTGGGAFLEFMEGKVLPAFKALESRPE